MAEYINIIVIRAFSASLFASALTNSMFGQVSIVLITFSLATLFVAVRATLPRIRYDQLIILTWKGYLPFILFLLIVLTPLMLVLSEL